MPTVTALKALADPLRLRMGLLMLEEGRTVKELAAILGVPPTRLYYHVRILERHGLIEVVERRMVSGIEERRYKAVLGDEGWAIGDDLRASTLAGSGLLEALFGAVQAEMHVAMQDAPDTAIGDPESAVPILVLTELALTQSELREVQSRLEELTREFVFDRPEVAPDAQRYHILLAGYRRPGAS